MNSATVPEFTKALSELSSRLSMAVIVRDSLKEGKIAKAPDYNERRKEDGDKQATHDYYLVYVGEGTSLAVTPDLLTKFIDSTIVDLERRVDFLIDTHDRRPTASRG